MTNWTGRVSALAILGAALCYSSGVLAQSNCEESRAVAQLVSVEGSVYLDQDQAEIEDWICPGVIVNVGAQSRSAVLLLRQQTILRINQNTRYVVSPSEDDVGYVVELLRGIIYFFSNVPQSLRIRTAFVNATIDGTELVVDHDEARTEVVVIDGLVRVGNDRDELLLGAGEAARTEPGEAPQPISVNTDDTVKWTLYYPSLGALGGASENARRASSLLSKGQADEAAGILAAAATAEPTDAESIALLAMVSVTRGDTDTALELASRAVDAAPDSAVAMTALSYAQQSAHDLAAALDSARRAVMLDESNSYAWARLSELQQATGDTRAARQSARRSVELDGENSRAHVALGYAELAWLNTTAAIHSFREALSQDAADPLAHLGLGLAFIKQNRLAEGRERISIAAGLDRGSSIIRSYLAKAYFEEGRSQDGFDYIDEAIAMDGDDPTPWLYSALQKQADNEPVRALRDLQRSIELNEGRAVYRSRFLLDEDLAVRGTSLAQVYDTLGFRQEAVIEAGASVALDPGNFSAHRFLADSFAALPRHELARSSALLQSQLLQPVNINPVQPSVVESDVRGASTIGFTGIGFNEYTPLFQRNRPYLLLSGVAGTQDTFDGEMVLNGVQDRFSYSVATSNSESDGYRDNNDYEHDVDNLYTQVAITPEANVQFEYRKRESDRGDVGRDFDSGSFSPLDRFIIENETPRIGLRWSPNAQSDVLLSWIHTDRTEESFQFLGGPTSEVDVETEADDYSGQYILRREGWNLVAGLNRTEIDREEQTLFDATAISPPGVCPPFGCVTVDVVDSAIKHESAYLYANISVSEEMTWTLGGSYDQLDLDQNNWDEFNPKLGLQWSPSERLRLRAAYFENLRRTIYSQQKLEPTQVAGFNQLYDDFDGTETRTAAIGLDWSLGSSEKGSREVMMGVELVHRDIVLPLFGVMGGLIEEDQNEDEIRLWTYATLGDRWSVTGELFYELFDREAPLGALPLRETETLRLPVSLRYFNPNGFFASVGATFLDQEITSDPPAARSQSDSTVLVDLALGYRLANRKGLLSIEVRNVLDEAYDYQDQNNRNVFPRSTAYIPERSIFAGVTLSF